MTVRERALITGLSVALIVLTGALIGPSFTPAREVATAPLPATQRYVEGVLGHATNASPFGARSAADRDLVALLFRGLVRLGPGDTIVGDLAERWDVDEKGSTWTFHLRPGMRWQDGEPITSEDVVFTIGALSDPDYTGPGAESWREVTATAIDGLTASWQRGSTNGASGLQPADARALAASGGARLVPYPGSSLTAVVLNLRTGKSPFGGNGTLRKALFEAIDRDALVSGVLAGLAVRADNLIPPTSPLFDAASSKQLPFDVEAAKKALTDAGWTLSAHAAWVAKGATEPVTFDLLSPEEAANPAASALAKKIAQEWQALGLKVTHV